MAQHFRSRSKIYYSHLDEFIISQRLPSTLVYSDGIPPFHGIPR